MASKDSILVSRTLYQIGMVMLVVSIVWVGSGIYRSLNQQAPIEVDKSTLEPIDTSLDMSVVETMSRRYKVEGELIASESATIIEVVETEQDEFVE